MMTGVVIFGGAAVVLLAMAVFASMRAAGGFATVAASPQFKATAVLVFAVLLAWMMRFDVQTVSRSDGVGLAYVLDRWSGAVSYCSPVGCALIEQR